MLSVSCLWNIVPIFSAVLPLSLHLLGGGGNLPLAEAPPLRQRLLKGGGLMSCISRELYLSTLGHLFTSTEQVTGTERKGNNSNTKLSPIRSWVPHPLIHHISSNQRHQLCSALFFYVQRRKENTLAMNNDNTLIVRCIQFGDCKMGVNMCALGLLKSSTI